MQIDALVVGNDHYNTLNVIRSLGEAGFSVGAVIVSDAAGSFVLKSRWVSRGAIVAEKDVVSHLLSAWPLASEGRIPLIPTYDGIASLLDANFDALSGRFILPSVGGGGGRIDAALEKDFQLEQARKAGFKIPFSLKVRPGATGDLQWESLKFPCIIKPAASHRGSKAHFSICRSCGELAAALSALEGKIDSVLVQEYVPNDNVIVVSGVRTSDGKTHIFGEIDKFKHSKATESLGLCCLGRWSPDSQIADECRRFVEAIDYYGCFSIDVVRVKGDARQGLPGKPDTLPDANYFMEINLRTDGLLYFYHRAGINFPALWARACQGVHNEIKPSRKSVVGMNEFLYFRHLRRNFSLPDLLKTDAFSTWSLKDPRPFFYRFLNKLSARK